MCWSHPRRQMIYAVRTPAGFVTNNTVSSHPDLSTIDCQIVSALFQRSSYYSCVVLSLKKSFHEEKKLEGVQILKDPWTLADHNLNSFSLGMVSTHLKINIYPKTNTNTAGWLKSSGYGYNHPEGKLESLRGVFHILGIYQGGFFCLHNVNFF